MIRFATLGPAGSNHEFVMQRYLEFHGLAERACVELLLDFHEGARQLIAGRVDFMMQVAVHPEVADVVAKHRHSMFVIDAFVSGSREMGIVGKRGVEQVKHLALQPATASYVDASRYGTRIAETSTASVAQGLLDGRYEAGLTYAALAHDHPDRFQLLELIGTVDDAWMLYGRAPVTEGRLVADASSPAARVFARMLEERGDA
jgi:hypothetical protein